MDGELSQMTMIFWGHKYQKNEVHILQIKQLKSMYLLWHVFDNFIAIQNRKNKIRPLWKAQHLSFKSVWIGRGCQSNCWTVTTIFWSTWGRIGTIEEATCEAANPFVCDNNNNMFAIGLDLYQDFREQLQASFGLATYKNKFFWETMGPLITRHLGHNFLQIPLLKTHLKSHFLFSRSGIFEKSHFSKTHIKSRFY